MSCECWLCAAESPVELDDYARDIGWHVQSHGWSVVALPAEHELPGWAYTVGLWHTLGAPEVCMFGLRVRDMHTWLNAVGDRVRSGLALSAGQVLDDVLAGAVVRPVHPSWHADLFAFGLDFYRGAPPPVLQLVWRDSPADAQPALWLPKDDHPPNLWTRLTDLVESPFPGVPVDALVVGSPRVIDGTAPVAGVVHTRTGDWEFLDARGTTERGVIHLRHLVAGHPHVRHFADLPRGFAAWQEEDGNWSIVPPPRDF